MIHANVRIEHFITLSCYFNPGCVVHNVFMVETNDAERRRELLERFMNQRGMNVKRWAEQAGVSPNTLYNFLNGRSERLEHDTYKKLAKAGGVPVFVLDGSTDIVRIDAMIRIKGAVQAGVWAESSEWDDAEGYAVNAPIPAEYEGAAYGVVVRGTSMNKVYPEGSIAIVVSIHDLVRDVRNGDRVRVRRTRLDGMIETTVKELIAGADGKLWLWPRSSDPRWQQPIEYDGRYAGDIESVQVCGVVLCAIIPEPNFV